MSKSIINVGVVEDHELLRFGLVSFVKSLRQYNVTFETASADDALGLMRQTPVDVLVVPIRMRWANVSRLMEHVRANHQQTKVLMIGQADPAAMADARRVGVSGVVSANEMLDDLTRALSSLAEGTDYWPQLSAPVGQFAEVGMMPFMHHQSLKQSLHETLSAREREVLLMIGAGKSSKEIARILGLSIRTIDVHRANLKRKLGMRTTSEMLKFAVLAKNAELGNEEKPAG
jgi:two-component system, NarL family, response regulator NreC